MAKCNFSGEFYYFLEKLIFALILRSSWKTVSAAHFALILNCTERRSERRSYEHRSLKVCLGYSWKLLYETTWKLTEIESEPFWKTISLKQIWALKHALGHIRPIWDSKSIGTKIRHIIYYKCILQCFLKQSIIHALRGVSYFESQYVTW